MPTGTVTFNNGTTAVGTVTLDSSGVATLIPTLANGNYSIVAVYSGDATHSPSTSQPASIAGSAGSFNVGVTPGTLTIKTTQNATVTVTLASSNGFADTIGLGCASLPVGVTCHFSPISVALAANGTASDQLTIDTNNPLSGGASAMNARGDSRGTYLAGLLLPFSVFFGWIFWRFRKRNTGLLTMVLVVALTRGGVVRDRLQRVQHGQRGAGNVRDSDNRHGSQQQHHPLPERNAGHHELSPERRDLREKRDRDASQFRSALW